MALQKNSQGVTDFPIAEMLTPREMEVLKSLAAGNSYQEIANELFISHETVKQHLKNIYRKMGVKNKIQAINRIKS
jgi:LuxR family maltose regulon positive regulatory protein